MFTFNESAIPAFFLEPISLAGNDGFAPHELNRIRKVLLDQKDKMIEAGRNIVVTNEPRISTIEVSDETITAQLTDGRMISVPLVWSWRLTNATPEQRKNFQIIGNGHGVHWPDVDEDISAIGMLEGLPARPAKHPV